MLVAAGAGVRLGRGRAKALVEVGGRTLLEHAVAGLAAAPTVEVLSVVVPPDQLDRCRDLVERAWSGAGGVGVPLVVGGGVDRQASVAHGLAALPPEVDVVLVHDAARAFAPVSLLTRVADAVQGDVVAVVPGLPVTDTIKRVAPRSPGGLARSVEETLERVDLVAVQTPQGFRADVLRAAHAADATADRPPRRPGGAGDDAGMVEAAGHTVVVVDGDVDAFKVTGPADLVLAEALLSRRQPGATRG